jgi:hypothetical protein
MLKTIITFAALATLAATSIAPAQAAIIPNGGGDNGLAPNAIFPNAIFPNGWGQNGMGTNGQATGGSTFSIQAIELPAETR